MRAAVLLFGVLNTFESIYLHAARRRMTIPGCLDQLGIEHDVFVATADKAFFKKFSAEALDGETIHGLPLIGVSKDDYYHVASYPAGRVRDALSRAFGARVQGLAIDESPYDANVWGGQGMYSHMIRTFLRRKVDAYDLMASHAAQTGADYDVVFIVRPDSQLRVREDASLGPVRLARRLARDLRIYEDDKSLFFVDFGAFDDTAKAHGLLKNDLAFGSLAEMRRFLSIADLTNAAGFQALYKDRGFRDPESMRVLTQDERDASPRAQAMTEVTLWPEYKMYEHAKALGVRMRCSKVTGGVVR